jgi:hypothetical protein
MSAIELTASICALIQASGLPPYDAYAAAHGAALRMWHGWAETRPRPDEMHDELTASHNAKTGIAAIYCGRKVANGRR